MIKKLLSAVAIAGSLAIAPAHASTEASLDLIDVVDDHVLVQYDTRECDGTFYGYYDRYNNKMLLCLDGNSRQENRDTLRHEVWHIVQHCISPTRGALRPVFNNPKDFHNYVLSKADATQVFEIMQMYPVEDHRVEIEAATMATILTPEKVQDFFVQACLKPRP